jgi:double zinc ribbon protein
MTPTCDYCKGPISEGAMNCGHCGAPFVGVDAALPDFRVCPFCSRRLLALASPACNYCGRRLPDAYLKAREGDLKRMSQVKDGEETSEVGRKVDELFRENLRRKRGSSSGSLGAIDIAGFFDLFS